MVQSVPALDSHDPMLPAPFRILGTRDEMPGCHSLILEPAAETTLADFAPGQFYMLYIFGHGEVPISISGDPAVQNRLTFTVMAVGAVTRALTALQSGEMVGLRGPFGRAWPVETAKNRDILIIAGGLGLAPLRPVIYQLMNHPDDYGRITLLYGTRTPEVVLFKALLDQWQRFEKMAVAITVDSAGRDWRGPVGVVTTLIDTLDLDRDATSAMMCGPEIMMRFCAQALLDKGLPSAQIYLSMERNMKCALGHCGRCQYGPYFICKDGPVFSFDRVEQLFKIREV